MYDSDLYHYSFVLLQYLTFAFVQSVPLELSIVIVVPQYGLSHCMFSPVNISLCTELQKLIHFFLHISSAIFHKPSSNILHPSFVLQC